MIQAFQQSMDEFMIQVPTQIFFGKTALNSLAAAVKQHGTRVLLVYGGGSIKKSGLYEQVVRILDENGLFHCEISGVEPNPRMSLIKRGIALGRENNVDVVLPIGGGSVIDTAKAIAGGFFHPGDFWELAGKNITSPQVLPMLCILTLPAAGSEMATGCTWVNDEVSPHIKTSFHGPYLRPRVAFLNPEFTYSLSPAQTAAGVADIMSHIIESYFSNETRAYLHARTAEGMMKTLVKYAPIAMTQPEDYEARANIMYCSSWGNNGIIVKGNFVSWSVHLLENPINEVYDTVHGAGLAVLTPVWLRWALRPENRYRYVECGVNVFGLNPALPEQELAEKTIECFAQFFHKTLGLPDTLRKLCAVKPEEFPGFAKTLMTPAMIEYQGAAFVPMDDKAAIEIYNLAY